MNRAFRVGPLALTAFLIVIASPAANAAESRIFKTELVNVRAEILADGLVHPWGMAFLPDGAVLVTERPGRLRIFSKGRISAPIPGVPKVYAHGQGGLLDVALAKDFAKSGTIFLSFAQAGRHGAGTAVARAKLVREGDHARLENTKIIFSTKRKTGNRQYGSRIVVDRDGSLFVTTGDGGQEKRAQDFFDAAGAVLHINPDGSIPADNPFRDGKKGLPQIWSKGHRNIEGAAIEPTTDRLWTVEHGPKGGDELNHPEAGKNYGWPVISYGTNYDGTKIGIGTHAPGYEQPVYYWDPSIAPSGLAIYSGSMFPEWRGDFLVGALKFELVARLHRNGSGKIVHEERMFKRAFGRIRDVRQAPDGSVWLLTDEENGAIIRLSRAR
ncbi:MAG TPA: PQQ-dependent sugar dehydrogenase [Rhizobiaceae bacterium]|nr:PQQ-dependent sugar dehydrogenase [Rhizobiaceae bacterium]